MNQFIKNIFYFICAFAVAVPSYAANSKKMPVPAPEVVEEVVCEVDSQLTDVSYEELRTRLEAVLAEKNKSLTFLDLKGLQAQMDVMVGHLVSESEVDKATAVTFLERTSKYYEQLQVLLEKTKMAAKTIKEDFVVPLATQTSLKAEVDKCHGQDSRYSDIFRILSKLNYDLNEILMLSPSHLKAQREKNKTLISKVDSLQDKQKINSRDLVENLNFIQIKISTITQTFDFNPKMIQLATAH